METYKILRKRFHGSDETIKTGLTLEEAQAHCHDPETSSRTCSEETREANPGTWFDAYTEE